MSIEKGASSWLNKLSLKRYHFDLTKTEFRDCLTLRYGWESLKTPELCSCGQLFSVSHSLQCNEGGYAQIRHVRDTFASVMKEVCYDFEIEPKLQPLECESFGHKTKQLKMRRDYTLKQPDFGILVPVGRFSTSRFSTRSLEQVP